MWSIRDLSATAMHDHLYLVAFPDVLMFSFDSIKLATNSARAGWAVQTGKTFFGLR